MEPKKKTIVWDDHIQPARNCIWVRNDNEVYEFDNNSREWKESKTIKIVSEENSEVKNNEYKDIAINERLPKYLAISYIGEALVNDLFNSDIIVNKDDSVTELIIKFSEINNLGKICKLVNSLAQDFKINPIYDKEDNFELVENDVKEIEFFSDDNKVITSIEYFGSNEEFDSNKIQEIEIAGKTFYEYCN